MNAPTEDAPGGFVLGDTVTDGVWAAKVVIDIDAGTALPPFKIEDWRYLERGVFIETREAGLVHYEDRSDLRRV